MLSMDALHYTPLEHRHRLAVWVAFASDLTSAHDLHDWLKSTQSKRWRKAKVGQEQTFDPWVVICRI